MIYYQSDKVELHCGSVEDVLPSIESKWVDLVIADPPAFIKAKKDIPTGSHAYMKLNSQGFRLAKSKGLVVSCSCSGLFNEEDFKESLRKSISRNQRRAQCVLRGGHAADHPNTMQFPEGFYLKMFAHYLE